MSILFFDVDGTIRSHDGISKAVIEQIHRVQKKGHLCFVATGRPYSYVPVDLFDIGFDGFIMANGANILYHDKIIVNDHFSQQDVIKFIHYFDDKGFEYAISTQSHSYMKKEFDYLNKFYHAVGVNMSLFIYEFKQNDYINDIVKIEVKINTKKEADDVKRVLGDNYFCLLDPSKVIEISRADVSKGTSIEKIMSILKVDPDDSYAFGDGLNDLGMFKAVGHAIAMGNADEEVKKAAERTCETIIEDGVAKELKRLF